MKKLYFLMLTAIVSFSVSAQVAITTSGTTWTPDSVHVEVGEDITVSFGGPHDFKQIEEDHFRASGTFNSSEITAGGFSFDNASGGGSLTGEFQLMIPGKYYYTCEPHYASGMRGIIVVNHPAPIAACTELFISEYMEGGGSNKAIEIYNPTSATVDLSDYQVIMYNNGGNRYYTFDLSGSLAAGEVFVLTKAGSDVEAIADATDGGVMNHNGDDAIVLYKNGVGAIDIIGYLDEDPGSEFTLVGGTTKDFTLVRKPTINAGTTDWSISSSQWDVHPKDTTMFFGAHTMNPCGGTVDTIVDFVSTSFSVGEADGTYDINLVLSQVTSGTVDVVLTSGDAADLDNYTTQTATFSSSNNTSITVTITDDAAIELDENFTFELQNPSANLVLGSDSIFTLTVEDNDTPIPAYDIATVTTVDAGGNIDSLGVECTLTGVVNSTDRGFNSVEFSFEDATGAITAYQGDSSITYDAVIGEEVEVVGTIDSRFGVTVITDIQSINVVGSGIYDTTVVTALVEADESDVVRVNGLTLVDESDWTTGSGSSGFDVPAVDASNDTVYIRIDRDYADLYNSAPPSGEFDIVGVVGQYDVDSPYVDGYQLIPRMLSDVIGTFAPPVSYTIGDATEVDANGEAVMEGTDVVLKGIITSPNFRETQDGAEFSFADATGGIWAYSSNAAQTFDPFVGDSVVVEGNIGFSNGVTRIYIDTVYSPGLATAISPAVVSGDLDESHEAELITINGLQLTGNWETSGGSYNVGATDGTTTYDIRIDADRVELYTVNLSTETFNLTGIGSQFDGSAPHDEGYQIMPRFSSDIDIVSAIDEIELADLAIYPNPAKDIVNVSFTAEKNETVSVALFNTIGALVTTATQDLTVGNNTIQVSVANVPTGVYFLEIQIAAGKTTQLVIVK